MYKYKILYLIKYRYKDLAAFCFPEISWVGEIPGPTAGSDPTFSRPCLTHFTQEVIQSVLSDT